MLVWHAIAIILACAVTLPVTVNAAFADHDKTLMSIAAAVFGAMMSIGFLLIFGIFYRMNKSALAAKLVKTMPNQCVTCNKPIMSSENHSDYHFVQNDWTSHIGTLSVHHKPECTGVGLKFLEKHSRDDDKNCMTAVHRIDGKTYSYDFFMNKDGLWFKISTPYDTLHDATIKFLRTYRRSPDVVLALRHGADKPDRIPILLSTKNPHIDQATFTGKAHKKAMQEADTMADRGVAVLGCSQIQEAKILSQYAKDTFIGLKASRAIAV